MLLEAWNVITGLQHMSQRFQKNFNLEKKIVNVFGLIAVRHVSGT